ncbi:hypothetical protein AB7M17_007186 [Bradyrhizobium sp. USDA 377]
MVEFIAESFMKCTADAPDSGDSDTTPFPGISGLIAWYDASVFSSLTLSGSTITNVADQSGHNNHLGDGTTFAKPTYSATGLNSRPAIMVSPGHALRSAVNAFPMGTGNTLTFFLVGTLTSLSQTNGRFISYYDGVGSDYSAAGSWIFFRNVGAAAVGIMCNSVSTVQSISYDTAYRFIGTINSSGVMTLYVNGAATSTATSSGNWIDNGTLGIGASISDTVGVDGAISEVGIATGFSDATAVAALDAYLKDKWGL